MFTYNAQASLKLGGKPSYGHSEFIYLKYSIGDLVFIEDKARKGKIERVCIKKAFVKSYQDVPLYQDTLNSVWFENELIPHQDAVNLAIAYYEQQISELN